MKKYKIILQFLIFGVMIVLSQNKSFAQYVTLEGKQFKLDGSNFNPIMMNYSVQAIRFLNDNSRYISPSHTYGDEPCFECTTKVDCNIQLDTDFTRIRTMKFNTIRICGFYPKYCTGNGILYFHFNPSDCWYGDSIPLYPLNPNDPGMATILPLYDSILSIASKDTLKVMFVLRGNRSPLDATEVTAWNNYINVLSSHFASSAFNDALFAYDLMNEPAYHVTDTKTKQEACVIIRTWYNTIKSNDTNHLVTLGIVKGDVLSFDPAVLKADFLNLHYYPEYALYDDRTDPAVQQLMRERSMNELYWMQQNCPIPWMIGETGFSASENHVDTLTFYDGLNGTLAEQDSFARVTLKAACNCGASGYSWFAYQDGNYNALGSPNYGSCYVGLLELWSGFPGSPNIKPAAQQFLNYNWGVTGPCPVSYSATYDADKLYYNPYRHPDNPIGNIITGQITDQFDNPIKDAVLWAHTLVYDDVNDSLDIWDIHYTHTDINGDYEIIPYDWDGRDDYDGYTIDILVSAPGAEREYTYTYDYTTTWSPHLTKTDFYYDTQTDNDTVYYGETKNFQGYNTLSVSNITVKNGATSEFKARNGVTINGSFTAALGSDVTIYCASTYPECGAYSGYEMQKKSHTDASYYTENEFENVKEIEVGFALPLNSLFVFPNPSNGIFTVQFTGILNENLSEIKIYDIYGREVYSKLKITGSEILDLSSFSKGVYYIRVNNSSKTFNKRIIIK